MQTLTTVERHFLLQHLHDYFPYGKTLREWYPNEFDPQERYQTTQHQRDFETNFDHRGARLYDADAGRFLSLDPLAKKYPTLSDYVYVANNPLIFVDPEGKWIEEIVQKGGGINGRDLVTIKITGKFMNYSSTDVDMEQALTEIKNMVESSFRGEDVGGVDIQVDFDFSIVESMEDVESSDHLLVLADGKSWKVPAMSNKIGGMVAFGDAKYFEGWYDTNYGEEGERSMAHEIGHLFGLTHRSGNYRGSNLMTQGYAFLRGNKITKKQLMHTRMMIRTGRLNRGGNTFYGGPNTETDAIENQKKVHATRFFSLAPGIKNGNNLGTESRIRKNKERLDIDTN
ncbi:MAG: RHS repeat-associated core domain-containing protein [Chitinophagales bacterium]